MSDIIVEESKIILIEDLIKSKKEKEEELARYRKDLEVLINRMSLLQHQIDVNKMIIKMIEGDKIIEVR